MVNLLDGKRRLEAVLSRKTGEEWQVIRKREKYSTLEYALHVPTGFSILDVQKQVDAIRASFGMNVEIEDYAGVVVVRGVKEDLPLRIDLTDDFPSIEGLEIVLGFDRDGNKVTMSNLNPHLLIAGCSGTGKTEATRVYLWQQIRKDKDTIIYLCDMKGSSFLPFEDLAVVNFAWNLQQLTVQVEKVYEEMNRRIQAIRKVKSRKLQDPWCILMIDEIAELWARPGMNKEDKKLLQQTNGYLSSLVRLGRELKIAVWMATQYPTREVLHNQIQSNLVNRVCLHMDNPLEYEVVLGHPLAHEVPQIKGRALVKGKGMIQIPYGGEDGEWEKRLEGMRKNGKDNDNEGTKESEYTDRIDGNTVDGFKTTEHVLRWEFPSEKSIRAVERIGKREND